MIFGVTFEKPAQLSLVIGLLAALAAASAQAQGDYELSFSGSIEASYQGPFDAIEHNEFSTFGGDATNADGPYKIELHDTEARVFGTDGGTSVTLRFNKPLEPGEYALYAETNDDVPASAVVYSDSEEKRLDFARARFGVPEGETGTLTLEAFGRDGATGQFSFTAVNQAEEPETTEVSGSFSELPYQYDIELDISGTGPFAQAPTDFNEAEARILDDGLEISLSMQWGPELTFELPRNEVGTYALGPDQPGSVAFGDTPGSGRVTLKRSGGTIGGTLEVEVTHQGRPGVLSGTFDYVPLSD